MDVEMSPFEILGYKTPEEFRDQTRFFKYAQYFCERFSELAPVAWRELLEFEALAAVRLGLNKNDLIKPDEAASILQLSVQTWADRYDIGSPWLQSVAKLTLFTRVLADVLGLTPPATLDFAHKPIARFLGNENVEVGYEIMTLRPFASVDFDLNLGTPRWDVMEETFSEFKKRMHQMLNKKIDDQEATIGAMVVSKDDLEVNFFWVDSFILIRVTGLSKRKVAAAKGVSRQAIMKAIPKAARYLRLPPVTSTEEE